MFSRIRSALTVFGMTTTSRSSGSASVQLELQ
jgi:hypothetical protein